LVSNSETFNGVDHTVSKWARMTRKSFLDYVNDGKVAYGELMLQ
jgi:hypothetical protein